MAIAWSGFPFASLLQLAAPLSSAKYVRMETFLDPSTAPGQRQTWYPWPYVEGLTIAEAANELAFLVTGAYGKPVSKAQGAPLRLAVPWKYGMVVVGGAGTLIGPIIGGVFFVILEHQLSEVTELWPLAFGAIFIAFVMLAPEGIWGLLTRYIRPSELEPRDVGEEASSAPS